MEKDFLQSSLYLLLVELVRQCNQIASPAKGNGSALTLQGRKLFGGRIRQELGGMTQSLLRAASITKSSLRRRPLTNTNVHFKTLSKLLELCCRLHFLREECYAAVAAKIEEVKKELWIYNFD
jgi:hypothetical protein